MVFFLNLFIYNFIPFKIRIIIIFSMLIEGLSGQTCLILKRDYVFTVQPMNLEFFDI